MRSSPSKKRRKVTAAEYKVKTAKRQKQHKPATHQHSVAAPAKDHSSTKAKKTSNALSTNSVYKIFQPNNGIDLASFRFESLKRFTTTKNLASVVSKYIAVQYSFFGSIESDNITDSDRLDTSNINPFLNKNRLLVEDFLVLPKHISVLLLVPWFSTKKHNDKKDKDHSSKLSPIQSNTIICDESSYVQFGNSRSQKFYLLSGNVRHNPTYHDAKSNIISVRDIKNAFTKPNNNGKGLILNVGQVCFSTNGIPIYTNKDCDILVKWLDVLDGRRDGIQVWCHTDYLRDFSKCFNVVVHEVENEILWRNILGFIFEELYSDKINTMNLLTKYYQHVSKKKSVMAAYLQTKENTSLSIAYSKANYDTLNNTIESVFNSAISKCYTDFAKVTEPLVSRETITELVSLYKQLLPEHYGFLMSILGFDKKIKQSRLSSSISATYSF